MFKPLIKNLRSKKALSLVELLIAVLILIPLFTMSMETLIRCIDLSDLAKNSSLAVTGFKNRLTTIESTNFSQIFNTYNNTTFTINGLNGIGKTYVDNSNPNHLVVTLSFSWQERNGRVIGEDKNLNGTLNAGEDLNGNGQIDSIVEATTQIYNM